MEKPLYAAKNSYKVPARILFFVLASLFIIACGVTTTSSNWPGLTVEDNVAYLAYGTGVAAFDLDTNSQLWSFPAEKRPNLLFYATPSVRDDRVIIGNYGANGGMFSPGVVVSLYALNKTGQQIWVQDQLIKDRIVAPPLQTEENLYVATNDNYMLSLDPATGSEKWRFEAGNSIYAQPVKDGDTLYVVSLDKEVHALNVLTGEQIWATELGSSIMNAPAINGKHIYVSSFDGTVYALDKLSGTEVWSFKTDGWMWAGPTFANGTIYFGDLEGTLYAVNGGSGQIEWKLNGLNLGLVQGSALVIDDTVYFVAGDQAKTKADAVPGGTVVAVDAAAGTVKWQIMTPAPAFTTPGAYSGNLLVPVTSSDVAIYIYDLETGVQQGTPLTPSVEG